MVVGHPISLIYMRSLGLEVAIRKDNWEGPAGQACFVFMPVIRSHSQNPGTWLCLVSHVDWDDQVEHDALI